MLKKPVDRATAHFWIYVLHVWTVFGLAFSNVLLGVAVLFAPFALRLEDDAWKRFRPVLVPLALYVLFLLTSIAASYRPDVSWRAAGDLFSLATFALGLLVLRDDKRLRLAMNGVCVLAGLLALWGLAQFLQGVGGLDWRIRGPFSHYMTFAGVLLMADLILVAQLASFRHGRWGWRWLALLLINAALIGSLTRSAWVALLGALAVLFVLRAPKFLLALFPAAILVLMLSPPTVRERVVSIVSLQDASNYDRICMFEAGVHMVEERPLFGHGPGMVDLRYPIYRHPSAPLYNVPHLHNTYIQIAAERGLLSLGAFLWFVGLTLWVGYRGLKREMPFGKGRAELWLGALTALVAFCLAGLFEDNWSDTEVQRVALFVMALPYCLRATAKESADDSGSGKRGSA